MQRSGYNEDIVLDGHVGFWYRLNLGLGAGPDVPAYFEDASPWVGMNLVLCTEDEAVTPLCRISMAPAEWARLRSEDRVKVAWDLSGKPVWPAGVEAPAAEV